ncbi:MAG TPA: hypothetical protein VN829_09865 [Dongiaceae bacterium]|nr:hypothetical protein [Dongiaceae bacterium]
MTREPAIPEAALRFEPVEDRYGTRLALVFGNEAPGGRCPFYRRQCHHCDLGAGEGAQFDTAMNRQRLSFFQKHYAPVLPRVAHLVVYNSGSVLNPRELAAGSLQAILEYAAGLPKCRVISVDSREAYITRTNLDRALGCSRPNQQLRPVLGLETQNDQVRLETLNKKVTRSAVEAACRALGHYEGRVGLDLNIVFGLPPLQGPAAAADAEQTARFGLELAERHGVPVDFNLHPYYPSRIGREHFPAHPRADLGAALEAAARIREVIRQSGRASMLFIGLQDESHDQEPAARRAQLARYAALFHRFNITQQPSPPGTTLAKISED